MKINKKFKILFVSFSVLFFSLKASSDTCSPPPSAVAPKLSSKVSYDKKTQLYKYQFTVSNGSSGQIPLDYFGLLINQSPASVLSPAHWESSFVSLSFAAPEFIWDTIAVKDSDAKTVTGDGALSKLLYPIRSGESLSGFEFSSPRPPGVVQFFAQGDTTPPSGSPTNTNDEPMPSCPGWDFANAQLLTQVTGMVTGPSDPNIISVKVRAREETGVRSCAPINPKSPSGKMAVLILSSSSFDASQINLSSILFGPAYAKPILSKVVDAGVGEKLDLDERAEWEKVNETLNPDADRKKTVSKNLLLIFDVAALDVQCNLDQALFIRGKTNSGQQFIGAVSTNTVGCEAKDISKHKKHPLPYKWWKT